MRYLPLDDKNVRLSASVCSLEVEKESEYPICFQWRPTSKSHPIVNVLPWTRSIYQNVP